MYYYFNEVKNEIERFFTKAKYILDGKDNLNPKVTAMVTILEGCSSKGDILGKKSDLYTNLYRLGINEFTDELRVTDQENHQFNLIDEETINELNKILNIDYSNNILSTLNKISLLRRNDTEGTFENAKFILLSGNSKTLKAAFNSTVNDRFRIPLATNLNFIINRFWYKLNKGFSNKDFPTSFSIISQSQIVLSKILNDNIGQKFDILKQKYSSGEITQETASNRIKDLRSNVKKPEEIKEDLTKDVLDFITKDSLEGYIDEQNHFKEKSKKLDLVSKELQEKKKESSSLQSLLIAEKEKQIIEKKSIIEGYVQTTENSIIYAKKKLRVIRILLISVIVLFYIFLLVSIFYFGWEKMELYTYLLGIPITLITLISSLLNKPLKVNMLWSKVNDIIKEKHLKRNANHTKEDIKNIKEDIKDLEKEIKEIKINHH